MNLLASCWTRLRCGAALPRIADEAARTSRGLVRQRVWTRAVVMPPAEARGYIRVQAANVVACELDRMLPLYRNSLARHRDRLVQMATQRLVAGLLDEMPERGTLAAPARRAA